jgi:peptide-methionine (S)-S-oxide reductase
MKRRLTAVLGGGLVLVAVAMAVWAGGLFDRLDAPPFPEPDAAEPEAAGPLPGGAQLATFGSGCFWCSEAVFQRLNGVRSAVPGYSGGHVEDPSYEQVCTGTTGHAEVVQVTYDPEVISYPELLEVFWRTHDPTTPDRQGHDVGPQYRSVIFYHNDGQRRLAEHFKAKLDASGAFSAPIVTELVAFRAFYPAEAHHRNYFNENGRQPYCSLVIRPKVEQFKKVFRQRLKPAEKAGALIPGPVVGVRS